MPSQPLTKPTTDTVTPQAAPDTAVAETLRTAAQALLSGNSTRAVDLLTDAENASTDAQQRRSISDMRSALADLPRPTDLVARALEAKVGEEVLIHDRGRDLRVRLNGVAGDTIRGDMVIVNSAGTESTRPVQFRANQLDPAEWNRWIENPATVQEHIVKTALLMQLNEKEKALQSSRRCGPLADLLHEEINAR
jgi:hypothetical protein